MTSPVAEPELKTPIRVEAREGFRIWVEFDDGVAGEVDVSDFASEPGFACWSDRSRFEGVRLNINDYLDWGLGEDPWEAVIDPDEIYSRITGLSIEEIYPGWAERAAPLGSGFPTVLRVEPRDGLTIWLEYSDGERGELDLSRHADGPAFAGWKDRAYFESVRISEESFSIDWGDDLQMCPDALYLELTGKDVDDVLPALGAALVDA